MKSTLILIVIILAAALWWWSQNIKEEEPAPSLEAVTVYFLNTKNFATGLEPYETAVARNIPAGADPKAAVLAELMTGPSAAEQENGLALQTSEATGLDFKFEPTSGLAQVYLKGGCDSRGSTYTIGNLISKNLRQFPEVKQVLIYDPEGSTLFPESGPLDSLPGCLQP